MPRRPRLLIDQACYHVLTRGNNRAAVFFSDADRQRYAQWLAGFSREHGVQIYHYCLMTNHVHLVVWVTNGPALRQTMQRLNLTYAKYLCRTYGHVGHVWQDRFQSLLIADDIYLLQCGGYIELNPVRAGLVEEPSAYPWSSHRSYVGGYADPLVTPSPAYLALGQTLHDRQVRYREYVTCQLRPPVADWLKQPVFGTAGQPASCLVAAQGWGTSRRRGRPRKTTAEAGTRSASLSSIS